jgi:hypothetical protein
MVEADSFSTEVTLEENYVLHHFEVFFFLSLNDRKCCTGISDSSEERVASRRSFHIFPASDCQLGSALHVVKAFDGSRTNFNRTTNFSHNGSRKFHKHSGRERTVGSVVDSEICDPRWRAAGFFVNRV